LGCNNLGVLYERGHGVPQDDHHAATLYEQACDGGYAKACYWLGVRYYSGDRVPRDATRAAALLERACDAADAAGCSALGVPVRGWRGCPQGGSPRRRAL
jgi:TPR repeat protein